MKMNLEGIAVALRFGEPGTRDANSLEGPGDLLRSPLFREGWFLWVSTHYRVRSQIQKSKWKVWSEVCTATDECASRAILPQPRIIACERMEEEDANKLRLGGAAKLWPHRVDSSDFDEKTTLSIAEVRYLLEKKQGATDPMKLGE